MQLTVRVADSATPPLESQQTASVTITVERNQFPPVFRNLPTTRSLPRTAGFGFSVYTVFANDSDIRVNLLFLNHIHVLHNSKVCIIVYASSKLLAYISEGETLFEYMNNIYCYRFQSPFNVVSYSLVSGTNQFQIDQTTGQITLQTNSLTQAEYVVSISFLCSCLY